MQTQLQQGGKKNKVVVPFYTPPSRLYGQTPAEIIKEARAAVMPTPALGIKPVFTNRPFTPKDNERTLFDSLRQKSKRQSAISSEKNYSLVRSSDTSGQVKLPSITSASKRKSHSIFHYSNNLSLDNLIEDYDAEILEEELDEVKTDKLPSWKKSHSCPKEGRMVKAASYNELNQKLFFSRNYDWDPTIKDRNGKSLPKSGSELEKKDYREKHKALSFSMVLNDNEKDETGNRRRNLHQFMEMTRGCGDHNSTLVLDAENLLMESQSKGSSKQSSKYERGDHTMKCTSFKGSGIEYSVFEKGSFCPQRKEQKKEGEKFTTVPNEKSKEATEIAIQKAKDEDISTPVKEEIFDGIKADRTSSEKSIETRVHESKYLLKMQEGAKDSSLEKSLKFVPLEILELYQTAEYYGVNVNENGGNIKTGTDTKIQKGNSVLYTLEKNDAKVEDGNLTCKKKKSIIDIGEKSDEKMPVKHIKTIASMENFTRENTAFSMNDKKRYHMLEEEKKTKEKAYERWNAKQEMSVQSVSATPSQGSWDVFWKNCYYETKEDVFNKKLQTNEKLENLSDMESLKRLLNKSTELFKLGGENSTIYEINCLLYSLLRSNPNIIDDVIKEKILTTVSLHSENDDPRVLLSIARLLFHLKVDSTLTTACKMIFNVARFDVNDNLFLNEEDILELFMEGVGRASPLDFAESSIYGYGALKFLTMNYNILSRTLHMGALDLMTLHLKLINTACSENGGVGEQTQHALFQLTGVLRHVAAGEGALPLFITTNCISVICKNLELFQKDEDIVTNISRTLSLVSTDESITQVLMSVENILSLIVDLLERYRENDKILIRLSFCLGNIVEHSDLARIQLLRSESSLSTLLNLLKFYVDKDLEITMGQTVSIASGELNSEVVDDIIVKVIRIIANMSMNPIVGSNLSPVANEKKSLQLSHLLSVLLLRKDPGITLLATLGCLNNVSYYCNSHSALIDITQGIERILGLQSEDCQAEAARVLGNLTRHKEIRNLIFNTGGVNQLINLLLSKEQEVVRCACGALVNMLLDSDSRKQFLRSGGIDRLVDAMELFSGDWSLASLAGRAIWNSCADDMSSAASHNNLERFMNTLATYLEEENWKDGDATWEEFASIATDLLEKINYHLELSQ